MNASIDCAAWWERPYRIVQTNLRLIDATLDPSLLAKQVRDFGATAITYNVGGIYAFFPTELPLHARNPYLVGDATGAMLNAAHDAGLKMVGRFDLSKGTRLAYDAHSEWFVHNREGEPQEYNGTFQACVNGGWASDYSLRILEEALARYPLDGAFFNMTGYQPVDYSGRNRGICWCRNCQDGFAAMFGRRLPEAENPGDPAYADYLLFKQRTSLAAAQRIYDAVKRLRPGTGVMGNGSGPCDFMRLELQRAVNRPPPEWPHQAGELSRWGAAKGCGKAYACASTNFLDFQWRYSSETPAHHMLRFGQQIASGAQIDYYLLGTFDQPNPAPLEPVREFMHWHAANEQHLWGTHSLAKVALYHSRASELHAGLTASGKHRANAFRGAYRLLLEARVPFDFVSDERSSDTDFVDRLARYDAIVLSDVACLGDQEARALDAYVERGGTLIATGESGLHDERGTRRESFALESFPALRLLRAIDDLETYVQIGEGELDIRERTLLHLDGWYFDVELHEDAERLFTLLPPQKYGPPELCFAEECEAAGPGALVRRFGEGRTIYLPWLPEWLYFRDGMPEHRALIAELVAWASRPPAKLTGDGPLELTIRAKDDGAGELVVHLVNYAGQRGSAYEEPSAISGLRLGVKGASGPARTLVGGRPVEVGDIDAEGYAWLELPPIKHFEIVVLQASAAR
jgi:hypothetical protein